MRISIREALFSGEEVDDWEPPKSEFFVCGDLGGEWKPLLDKFPDRFNLSDSGYGYETIASKDRKKIRWGCIRLDPNTMQPQIVGPRADSQLDKEALGYIYYQDAKGPFIVFCPSDCLDLPGIEDVILEKINQGWMS